MNGSRMKKHFIIAAVAVAAAVSCRTEVPQAPSFEAIIPDASSRVYLEENVKCRWSSGDVISVFGASGTNYWFSTDDYGATAIFNKTGDQSVEPGLNACEPYVIYPYRHDNSLSGSVVRTWIDPVQTPVAGSFPTDQPPVLVARSTVAGKLAFSHAGAIVKVELVSEGVTAIVLQGENGEHLNGVYNYDFGTGTGTADGNQYLYLQKSDQSVIAPGVYYMVVAPTELQKGLTLKVLPDKDNVVGYKYSSKPATLAAGHILDLGTIGYQGDTPSGGGPVTETRTGLSDGYYDVSFTASRSLSGGIVYATASSGSGPARMTPIRYGSGVKHIIRGVQVSGGSCTFSTVEADSSPADYSVSDIQFNPSAEWTWLQGGDYSRLNLELDHGVSYKVGGSVKDAVDIAVENGWNIVRLRVFNDPGNTAYSPSIYMTKGYVCLDDMLKLARKAKKAGLKILLTLHYSDYWTDPLIQNPPHEWSGYTEPQLRQAVYDFTYDVLVNMDAQNTPPQYVAIGNETNTGMLYGGGINKTGYNTAYRNNPAQFAAFFNQGAKAVRDVLPSSKVVLHLANPHSNLGSLLSSLNSNSLDYDILGISYYPFWSGFTASEFVSRADGFATTAGRKVMVMETGFNWSTVTYYGDAGQLENQGPYETVYPASPENQRNYLQELLVELKKSSSVIGVFYWDPLTVRLNSWAGMDNSGPNHDNGTVTHNSSLFDFDGNALEGWKAFKYNN